MRASSVPRKPRQCPMRRTGEHLFTSRQIIREEGVVVSDDVICSWCTARKPHAPRYSTRER